MNSGLPSARKNTKKCLQLLRACAHGWVMQYKGMPTAAAGMRLWLDNTIRRNANRYCGSSVYGWIMQWNANSCCWLCVYGWIIHYKEMRTAAMGHVFLIEL